MIKQKVMICTLKKGVEPILLIKRNKGGTNAFSKMAANIPFINQPLQQQVAVVTANFRKDPVISMYANLLNKGYTHDQIMNNSAAFKSAFHFHFNPQIEKVLLSKSCNTFNIDAGFDGHYFYSYYHPIFNMRIYYPMSHSDNSVAAKVIIDNSGNFVKLISTIKISSMDIFNKLHPQFLWNSAKIFDKNIITTSNKFAPACNQFFDKNFNVFGSLTLHDFNFTVGNNGIGYHTKIDSQGTVINVYVPTVQVIADYIPGV